MFNFIKQKSCEKYHQDKSVIHFIIPKKNCLIFIVLNNFFTRIKSQNQEQKKDVELSLNRSE